MDPTKIKMTPVRVSAVILTTLMDLNGAAITGPMYAALCDKVDFETFTSALDILDRAGYTRNVSKHQIEITPAGKKAAEDIDLLLKKSSGQA